MEVDWGMIELKQWMTDPDELQTAGHGISGKTVRREFERRVEICFWLLSSATPVSLVASFFLSFFGYIRVLAGNMLFEVFGQVCIQYWIKIEGN